MAGSVGASFVDIHAHFFSLKQRDSHAFDQCSWPVVLSSHGKQEMQALTEFSAPWLWRSAGIHPQDPQLHLLETLHQYLSSNHFSSVGEIGFDLFPNYAQTLPVQNDLFICQINLAIQYHLPIILHVRRAMERIFLHKRLLKRVPVVIFHSYPGSYTEAISILKSGINAYFSFGTPVLWGAKQANICLKQLPVERIFLETDAPWQPVRTEDYTSLFKIQDLYTYTAAVRGININYLAEQIFSQFHQIFILPLSDDQKCEHAQYI